MRGVAVKGSAILVAGMVLGGAPAPAAGQGAGGAPLACTPYAKPVAASAADLAEGDRLVGTFERSYPAALVSPAGAERTPLAPEALARLVADLACVASHPGADPFVPEQALALFASKRHGRAAFAALDRLARSGETPPALRAAARAFERQMRSYASGARRGNG